MMSQRQSGLTKIHLLLMGVGAVLLLYLMSKVMFPVPATWRMETKVSLLPYAAAMFIGVLMGEGHIKRHSVNILALHWTDTMRLAARQVMYGAAILFTFLFLTQETDVSRKFIIGYFFIAWIFFCWLHRFLPKWVGIILFPSTHSLPILLIGQGKNLSEWLLDRRYLGIETVGYLSDEPPGQTEARKAPYLGSVADLQRTIRNRKIAQVILMQWPEDTAIIQNIIATCEKEGVRFLIHNDYSDRFSRNLIPVVEGGLHFLALQEEPLQDPINRTLKRILDIAVALPVVLFFLPFLALVVAVMQQIQAPGPLMFIKPRSGRNRQHFTILKFRTMYVANADITRQATKGDSRIYPFGAFLRRSSLDEIPQFFNVLKGEMSVVGPRPHLPEHDELFSAMERSYNLRSFLKPGITGLAQINGYRGEITEANMLKKRVYWDLFYGSNWSIWMDLNIILRTGQQVLRPPKSAY